MSGGAQIDVQTGLPTPLLAFVAACLLAYGIHYVRSAARRVAEYLRARKLIK